MFCFLILNLMTKTARWDPNPDSEIIVSADCSFILITLKFWIVFFFSFSNISNRSSWSDHHPIHFQSNWKEWPHKRIWSDTMNCSNNFWITWWEFWVQVHDYERFFYFFLMLVAWCDSDNIIHPSIGCESNYSNYEHWHENCQHTI